MKDGFCFSACRQVKWKKKQKMDVSVHHGQLHKVDLSTCLVLLNKSHCGTQEARRAFPWEKIHVMNAKDYKNHS